MWEVGIVDYVDYVGIVYIVDIVYTMDICVHDVDIPLRSE